MNLHKRECLKRARELVQSGSPESLRYACLELRYCIESIAYEKLNFYREEIGGQVLDTWQPRKIIEILAEYDPNAVQSYTYVIQTHTDSGESVGRPMGGSHVALSPAMLRKHYNKLGGYLHVPTPKQKSHITRKHGEELRDYLAAVIIEIEPTAMNTADLKMGNVVSTECLLCGTRIVKNELAIKNHPEAICPRDDCGAIYDLELDGSEVIFCLRKVYFQCDGCNTQQEFPAHLLKEGNSLTCHHCGQEFKVQRQWRVVQCGAEDGKAE